MDRIEIAKSVIKDWARTLGISEDFCNVFKHSDGEDYRLIISFKDRVINDKVLNSGVKDFGGSNLAKYVKEDIDNFLFINSLYLFANKHGELHLIKDILDCGEKLYVTLHSGSANTQLIKLFQLAKSECKYNTYSIKKSDLKTFYLFFATSTLQ